MKDSNNPDALYKKLQEKLSDADFEVLMQDGRIDDGEWQQLITKLGMQGANPEALLALKARAEKSWNDEHKDKPGITVKEANEIERPEATPSNKGNSQGIER